MINFSFRGLTATALLLAAPLFSFGQVAPQIAKSSTATVPSAFLFGSDAARKTQLLYSPANLPNAVAGPIRRVYFMYATSNATVALTDLRLTLGQTADTVFVPATRFYPGQRQVLRDSAYTIPAGSANGWFGIDLDSTFAYDPTRTLIVGVAFATSSNQAFSTLGSNTFASPGAGKKLYAAADTATVGFTSSGSWPHFGFDNRLLGTTADAALAGPLLLFPNPAADRLTVVLPEAEEPATLTLTDVLGRVVLRREAPAAAVRTGEALDVHNLPAGTYALTVEQAGRRQTRRVSVR